MGIESRLKKAESRVPEPTGPLTIRRIIVEPNREPGGAPVVVGELQRATKCGAPRRVLECIDRQRRKSNDQFAEPTGKPRSDES